MASRDGTFVFWQNGLPLTGKGLIGSPGFSFWENGLPLAEPGSGFAGTTTATLAALTVVSVATNPIVASTTQTLAALTVASAVTNPIVAAASQTLGDVTLSSAGTIPGFGTTTQTLEALAISATGSGIAPGTGSVIATLNDVTISSAAGVGDHGALASTLGTVTSSSAGTVTGLVGTLVVTLADATSSSTGAVAEIGALTKTLAALTLAAEGIILIPRIGTLVKTLSSLTPTITGLVLNPIHGVLSKPLGALTGTLTGSTSTLGALTATLGSLGCTASIGWPATIPLRPDIDDDRWGGDLSYAWSQVSGPVAATIVSPTSKYTDVRFADLDGVYFFQLAVSRELDALVGTTTVRVRIYASLIDAAVPGVPGGAPGGPAVGNVPWLPWGITTIIQPDLSPEAGPVFITVQGGLTVVALLNTVQISESIGQPSTCSFKMYGSHISVGNEVTLDRFGSRLFGGVCLSVQITDVEGHVFTSVNLIGYAWHLGRKTITANYLKKEISDIVHDILALAPGGITTGVVQLNLGLTNIIFTDTFLNDALTQLTKLVAGLHWEVDSHKVFTFGVEEIGDGPEPITAAHTSLRDLTVTHTLAQTANRVILYYGDTLPAVSAKVLPDVLPPNLVPWPPRPYVINGQSIQVDSLKGYDPKGGDVLIGGNRVHYTGISSVRTLPIYGVIQTDVRVKAVEGGEFGAVPHDGAFTYSQAPVFGYYWSIVTPDGETPPLSVSGGTPGLRNGLITPLKWIYETQSMQLLDPVVVHESALEITMAPVSIVNSAGSGGFTLGSSGAQGPATAGVSNSSVTNPLLDRVSQINIYRWSREPGLGETPPAGQIFLVGSIPRTGGTLVDSKVRKNLVPLTEPRWKYTLREDGSYPWDPPNTYYLTGCTGVTSAIEKGTSGQAFVVVNDVHAQTELAEMLGAPFGDSSPEGVVESVQKGPGNITTVQSDGTTIVKYTTTEEALVLAKAYLSKAKAVSTTLSCSVEDADARAGQTIDMSMPEPYGDVSLKIHQSTTSGFEAYIPHRLNISAGTDPVTLDDLIRHILPDEPPKAPDPRYSGQRDIYGRNDG